MLVELMLNQELMELLAIKDSLLDNSETRAKLVIKVSVFLYDLRKQNYVQKTNYMDKLTS